MQSFVACGVITLQWVSGVLFGVCPDHHGLIAPFMFGSPMLASTCRAAIRGFPPVFMVINDVAIITPAY